MRAHKDIFMKLMDPFELVVVWMKGFSTIGLLVGLIILLNMGYEVKQALVWLDGGRDYGVGVIRGRVGRRLQRERLQREQDRDRERRGRALAGGGGVGVAVRENVGGVEGVRERDEGRVRNAQGVGGINRQAGHEIHPHPPPPVVLPPGLNGDNGEANIEGRGVGGGGGVEGVGAVAGAVGGAVAGAGAAVVADTPPSDLAIYIKDIAETIRLFSIGVLESRWDDEQLSHLDLMWDVLVWPALKKIFRDFLILTSKIVDLYARIVVTSFFFFFSDSVFIAFFFSVSISNSSGRAYQLSTIIVLPLSHNNRPVT